MKRASILLLFLLFSAMASANQCQSIYRNGDEAAKFNIAFVGDGYTTEQTAGMAKSLIDEVFGPNGVKPYSDRFSDFNFFVLDKAEPTVSDCLTLFNGLPTVACSTATANLLDEACPFTDVGIRLSNRNFRSHSLGLRGPLIHFSYAQLEEIFADLNRKLKVWNAELISSPTPVFHMAFAHELSHTFGLYDEYGFLDPSTFNAPASTGSGKSDAGYPNCQDSASASQGFWWKDYVGQGFGAMKILSQDEQALLKIKVENRNFMKQTAEDTAEATRCALTRQCSDYAAFLSYYGPYYKYGYCLGNNANYRPSAAALMTSSTFAVYAFQNAQYQEAKTNILNPYNIAMVDSEITRSLAAKKVMNNEKEKYSGQTPENWKTGFVPIQIKAGYTFVNVPLETISSVKATGCDVNSIKWLQYDLDTHQWKEKAAIQGGAGYAAYSPQDCEIEFGGKFYYGSTFLKKGWSLAGFPLALKNKSVGKCEIKRILELKNGNPPSYGEISVSDMIAGKAPLDIKNSYWFYMDGDCQFEPEVYPWQQDASKTGLTIAKLVAAKKTERFNGIRWTTNKKTKK